MIDVARRDGEVPPERSVSAGSAARRQKLAASPIHRPFTSLIDHRHHRGAIQPERTDQPVWARSVIANGKLYIRDQDTLFCYDVKARGE